MKKLLFLLGFICALIADPTAEKTYSMSGKRMMEVRKPSETEEAAEGLGRLKQTPREEKETSEEREEFVVEPLKQPEIIVNEQNIAGLYRELSDKGAKPKVRKYPDNYSGNYYEMYTGEILEIRVQGIDSLKVAGAPYMSQYDTLTKEDMVFFETYHQGEYRLNTVDREGNTREIAVRSRHKYSFTEEQNYDIILNSYNKKDIKAFASALGLFEISFPDSFKLKDLYFMDAELSIASGDGTAGRDKIRRIRSSYSLGRGEENKLTLMEKETYEKGSMQWENFLYKNRDAEGFKEELLIHIYSKTDLNRRDVELLKREYSSTREKAAAKALGDHYSREGSVAEAVKYLNYAEDYEGICRVYLASHDLMAFEEALERVDVKKRSELIKEKEKLVAIDSVERELTLGRDRFESNNYQEAILFFERAKRRNSVVSGELGVELDLGKSYYNLMDYEKAAAHLERVAETAKDSYKTLEATYYLAMSYYRGETQEESLKYFEKIVRDYPETSWAKKSMIYIMRLRKEQ